jgi:hypothetical protein
VLGVQLSSAQPADRVKPLRPGEVNGVIIDVICLPYLRAGYYKYILKRLEKTLSEKTKQKSIQLVYKASTC